MYQDPESPFRLPELPDSVGQIQPFPRPVVWTAGVIIVLLAGFGLFQGIHGAASRNAGGEHDEESVAGAVSAQAATPLPANTQWSALSGPAMGSPTPKVQSSAAAASPSAEEAAPESEAPAAPSAAESAAPETQSSAPAEPQLLPAPPPAGGAQQQPSSQF